MKCDPDYDTASGSLARWIPTTGARFPYKPRPRAPVRVRVSGSFKGYCKGSFKGSIGLRGLEVEGF